jgi:hypothetical protein
MYGNLGLYTLEPDLLLRLEVVKIVDEFKTGYKTPLELDLLLDPEVNSSSGMSVPQKVTQKAK